MNLGVESYFEEGCIAHNPTTPCPPTDICPLDESKHCYAVLGATAASLIHTSTSLREQ